MNNLETAIAYYSCPVCGAKIEECIIINSILTEKEANNVKSYSGKCIGYSNHVCDDCKQYIDKGVFVIAIDPDKSKNTCLETMYRTGQYAVLSKDAEILNIMKDFIIKLEDNSEICFMDFKVGKELEIWI